MTTTIEPFGTHTAVTRLCGHTEWEAAGAAGGGQAGPPYAARSGSGGARGRHPSEWRHEGYSPNQ
jgi:hypothetical protein